MNRDLRVLLALVFISAGAHAQLSLPKTLDELVDSDSTTWKRILLWQENADNKVELLPPDSARSATALVRAQVSTNTLLGSIIYHSGGILIDNGWIRILGSGSNRLDRSLPDWNKGKLAVSKNDQPVYLLVADDVIGGLFAIKSESPEEIENTGMVFYYGPNGLSWQSTGLSYNNFINFCFSGNIKDFYDGFQWKGWQEDIKGINSNQVFSCYPLLWTREGIQMRANRKVLAIQKQWDMYQGKPAPPKQKTLADRRKGK